MTKVLYPVKRNKPQGELIRPAIGSSMNNIDDLVKMMTYRRPGGSNTERQFIRDFIIPSGAEPDALGNYCLRIGSLPVIWSAHTDTVATNPGFQRVDVSEDQVVTLSKENFLSNCLGADDSTGCWIMLEMIKEGIPGYYIFHRGEERGGVGSKWKALNETNALEEFSVAIAFDRAGYGDVITSQFGSRTASNAFAESLAIMLGSWFKPTSGVYTDTAEYSSIIPECTNLSVGYFNQHSEFERQDLLFASWLRDKMVTMDVSVLPNLVERDLNEMPDYNDYGYSFGQHDFSSYNKKSNNSHNYRAPAPFKAKKDLLWYVENYPKATADFLETLGVDITLLKEHIYQIYHWDENDDDSWDD